MKWIPVFDTPGRDTGFLSFDRIVDIPEGTAYTDSALIIRGAGSIWADDLVLTTMAETAAARSARPNIAALAEDAVGAACPDGLKTK